LSLATNRYWKNSVSGFLFKEFAAKAVNFSSLFFLEKFTVMSYD